MRKASILFILMLLASPLLRAQEADSARFDKSRLPVVSEELWEPLPLKPLLEVRPVSPKVEEAFKEERFRQSAFSLNNSHHPVLPYWTDPSPRFRGDYTTGGVLMSFRHGVLTGSGGQESLPGMGRMNRAAVGYQHFFNDKWMLQVGVDATKLNFIHSTGQTFATSAQLIYRATDLVSFRAFGSYAIGNGYGFNTHSYGGTVKLDMSDRFSLEMGAQRYYNAYLGKWETVPVVIPSYRFNDKFKLEMDVGGLLFDILREVVHDKRRKGEWQRVTIMPPRP